MRSPDILPAFARRCSVLSTGKTDWGSLQLPEDLRAAIPRRQQEFLAGRYCAASALEQLFPGTAPPDVGRGTGRAPQWPEGVTGSLTHTGPFASAGVARTSDARGLGIDTERLARFERLTDVARLVILPDEAGLGGGILGDSRRLPLVFSAKEAIFKCLYPLVGRTFYFESAVLSDVDVDARTFSARPTMTLAPGVDPGLRLSGRFEFDDEYVHTGVWVEPA